jgi:hypothetical protein
LNTQLTTTPARSINPNGIARRDAIRSLLKAGYSGSQVSGMIETLGADRDGAAIWRWRTPAGESHVPG